MHPLRARVAIWLVRRRLDCTASTPHVPRRASGAGFGIPISRRQSLLRILRVLLPPPRRRTSLVPSCFLRFQSSLRFRFPTAGSHTSCCTSQVASHGTSAFLAAPCFATWRAHSASSPSRFHVDGSGDTLVGGFFLLSATDHWTNSTGGIGTLPSNRLEQIDPIDRNTPERNGFEREKEGDPCRRQSTRFSSLLRTSIFTASKPGNGMSWDVRRRCDGAPSPPR